MYPYENAKHVLRTLSHGLRMSGLGVREIERITGVSKATISHLMSEKEDNPKLETLVILASVIGRQLRMIDHFRAALLDLPDDVLLTMVGTAPEEVQRKILDKVDGHETGATS